MEIIGRLEIPDIKTEGERRSDMHDVESLDITMRGLRRMQGAEIGQVPAPTEEHPPHAETETTPAGDPIWDEVLEWCP
jgi:hypothetical protein